MTTGTSSAPLFVLAPTPWPVEATHALLRRVALALLDDLLASEKRGRPQLARLGTPAEAETLAWWWSPLPTRRLRRAFAVPPARGRRRIEPQLAPHLLAPFSQVAAASAWCDLQFTAEVSRRLGQWMLDRWLMPPAVYLPPLVAARTWAVLLGLAQAGPRPGGWRARWHRLLRLLRIRRADADPALGWQRLQGELVTMAMAERWAGFWDQWLIRRALARWPQAGSERPGLRAACEALPLDATDEVPPLPGVAALARLDWEAGRPLCLTIPPLRDD